MIELHFVGLFHDVTDFVCISSDNLFYNVLYFYLIWYDLGRKCDPKVVFRYFLAVICRKIMANKLYDLNVYLKTHFLLCLTGSPLKNMFLFRLKCSFMIHLSVAVSL